MDLMKGGLKRIGMREQGGSQAFKVPSLISELP
jgi:hypothetical protein